MIIINEYEFQFGYFQIDITGKCNLKCKHCRAEDNKIFPELSLDIIKKVIDFGIKGGSDKLTISGGEPLLHLELKKIIKLFYKKGGKEIVLTTNGLLINKKWLNFFRKIKGLRIQVSIDSPNKNKHDEFRGMNGSFDKAIKSIKSLVRKKIETNIRCTIGPNNIEEMEDMIKLALSLGVNKLSLGLIIASGAAITNNLIFTPEKKKKALDEIRRLTIKYHGKIEISNEDPLRCHFEELFDLEDKINFNDEALFGGCNAGLVGFYCSPEGIIQPCSLLPIKILNAKKSQNIYKQYSNSDILKKLSKKQYKGKCGACFYKRICGGCRANAFGITGDYLESDPTCWKSIKNKIK